MTRTTLLPVLLPILLTACLASIACQSESPELSEPTEPSPTTDTSTEVPSDSQPAPEAAGVEFEPAYPTEVSEEGLSDEDVAQQTTTHSHEGGDAHTHAAGTEDQPDDGSKGQLDE